MRTIKVDLSKESSLLPQRIVNARTITNSQWIDEHGSGTLRDNKELKFVWSMQCLAERIAYTFGYGFGAYKEHLVTFNDSISECDEQSYTLAGRWMKRYLAMKLFPEDYFELKYVIIKDESGKREWEGIGVIVRETSASFVPDGIMIVAKIAMYNTNTHQWQKAVNFA